MSAITWDNKFFSDLTLEELYAIGRFRQEIFVVEQDCPYIDFDNKDQDCWHVMGWDAEGDLVAYTRLCPVGISYPNDISIGRVLTSAKVRRTGIGRILMQKSIEYAWELWGKQNIRISAQDYLLRFYGELGFADTGKKYLEDGIPHTEMYLEI